MRRPARPTFIVLALGLSVGCKQAGKTNETARPSGPKGEVVAKIGDREITVGELEEQINKQSSFARARYASVERRKEFLDNLVRFEVLSREAERRGFDKDPDVVRVWKQQAVTKFIQKEFDPKFSGDTVPIEEVQKYYDAHKDEFTQAPAVRISQIFVRDEVKGKKAAGEAKAAKKGDDAAWAKLVDKYSEDDASKPRGGDLGFVDKMSRYPKEVLDAAEALKDIGDVSPLLKTDKGFHVLRLTGRREGFVRPLAEVERTIRSRMHREHRAKEMDTLVERLRTQANVQVFEDKLAKVEVDQSPGPGGPPGMPPGMGPPTGVLGGSPNLAVPPPGAPPAPAPPAPTPPAPAPAPAANP